MLKALQEQGKRVDLFIPSRALRIYILQVYQHVGSKGPFKYPANVLLLDRGDLIAMVLMGLLPLSTYWKDTCLSLPTPKSSGDEWWRRRGCFDFWGNGVLRGTVSYSELLSQSTTMTSAFWPQSALAPRQGCRWCSQETAGHKSGQWRWSP